MNETPLSFAFLISTVSDVLESAATEFVKALGSLVERRDLSAEQMRWLLEGMIAGRLADTEAATLLVALRMKGESAEEIAAAAGVLRQHMVPLETGRPDVLDTCGTGGDGAGTFNISTAVALVTAAAGVPVVKHGNRAVSSQSGSADLLAELGVPVESGVEWARQSLRDAGLAFCFAPHFHPALRNVAALRRKLHVRTILNCLGPLVNPAGTPYQLLGVGRSEWLDPLAGALARLGTKHAFLVWSQDGLDEISLCDVTLVREVRGSEVKSLMWSSADFELEPCRLNDLRATGPKESAAVVRDVLEGKPGPPLRVVLANTAAALLAAERVGNLPEGVRRAAEAIESGRARQVLEKLCKK